MNKLPWFPFWGRDFFGDEKVKLFNLRQIGIYLTLLWHEWEHGTIPSLDECKRFPIVGSEYHADIIRNYSNAPMDITALDNELKEVHFSCFTEHTTLKDRYINQRLESIRVEQVNKDHALQDRARKGGIAKALLKQYPSSAYALLNPAIQSQSQSQNQIQKKEKKSPPLRAAAVVQNEWIEDLKKNPAYLHINWIVEFGKMDAWFSKPANRYRKRNQSFILNWINKVEAPIDAIKQPRKVVL